ncbi:MAG TPA: flavodoxin domain-containing protein [Gemmatimonadales bacterium]|nr:flavodoxin domain-containing protein [Gemmatimonadales bacterium]
MSRILILFGTTDGQTAKIAHFLGDVLGSRGADIDVIEAGTAPADPAEFDAVIVAASVHAGGYQRAVVRWARAHAQALREMPAAFLSVCLGVLQKDERVRRDLDGIQARFEATTGWRPPRFKLVAGALKYTRYGLFRRMVMRHIAGRAGGSTDVSRDHEYTDWADLRAFGDSFYDAFCADTAIQERLAGVR